MFFSSPTEARLAPYVMENPRGSAVPRKYYWINLVRPYPATLPNVYGGTKAELLLFARLGKWARPPSGQCSQLKPQRACKRSIAPVNFIA